MAKHDQRPDKSNMVCPSCREGVCGGCVDVLRSVYTDVLICQCTRVNHSGEPSANQILDPETDSVYGPHAVIKADGTVVTDEEFKELWREQFGD